MPDKFSKETRSRIMSQIRSKGSKIEITLKRAMEEREVKFVYQPKIAGNPDFLVEPSIAVFCDGSFWHGRNWRTQRKKIPQGYWQDHIGANVARDKRITKMLRHEGFVVLRFWEEEIEKNHAKVIEKIIYEQNYQRNSLGRLSLQKNENKTD
jgi:DNA mismatch endonuclease (patch repair protein)